MNLRILGASCLALAFAACGAGGGSGSGSSGSVPTTNVAPPVVQNSSARSVASLSLTLPRLAATNVGTIGTASARRSPEYLSPGTDKIAIMLDKHEVVTDQPVVNFNNAGSGNGTFTGTDGSTFQISYDSTNPAYYAVKVIITTTPGTHEFGVVIKSGTPAYVLSEGQGTFNLVPTPAGDQPQSLGQLLLTGVIGSGYIECDTATQNLDATGHCSSYANFSPAVNGAFGGTYSFTAVAADYDGFPLVYQTKVGKTEAAPFDNGGFKVVETDGNNIVTLNNSGPFTNPGNHLTGPSSGYVPGTNFIYGQPFTLSCNKIGTATLALQLVGGAQATVPVDGYNYTNVNGYAPGSQTDNSTLPVGGQTVVKTGRIPQVNVTVNCTASGTLQLI